MEPWSISILPFPKMSVRESSLKTIGGPFNMSREENVSFVQTMCLEALESMIKLGELDVPATKACTFSLSFEFDPPSLFFDVKKGDAILLQELGQHVYFLLHTRDFSVLIAVCSLAHFSFILLL